MCIKLFREKIIIPHPEEPRDPSITMENYKIEEVSQKWFGDYEVPLEHRDYWKREIDVQVYDIYPEFILKMGVTQENPACAWGDSQGRHIACHPEYLSAGLIAHEQAHNSHSLLLEEQKQAFTLRFDLYADRPNIYDVYFVYKEKEEAPDDAPGTVALLNYLMEKYKRYEIHGSAIELHAEVYRYLGQYMPEDLKKFYPKLFNGV